MRRGRLCFDVVSSQEQQSAAVRPQFLQRVCSTCVLLPLSVFCLSAYGNVILNPNGLVLYCIRCDDKTDPYLNL